MPKFEVVSEYTPSGGSPQKQCFCGGPGFNSNGQAKPVHFKVLACAKTLVRRTCGGGPQARCWPPVNYEIQ